MCPPAVQLCLAALVLPGAAAHAEDAWNLFTTADDARLGDELSAWLAPRVSAVDDRKLERYLDRLGARLEKAGGPLPFPIELQLVNAAEPYALALPGGRVVLSSGLLSALESERQLAGVLAHVAAHAELRHTTRAVSRAERFRAQAAIVVAEESDKSLLQTLDEVSLDVFPGAPLMRHDPGQEAEADAEAGDWLDLAGYGADALAEGFERLHSKRPDEAARFLERHPGARSIRAPPADPPRSRRPVASARQFKSLQERAGQFQLSTPGLDLALEWTPPPQSPRVARRHERFITRHYQLEYPLDWRPGKPGQDGTIEVTPKGGMENPAGARPQVAIGIMAGAPAIERRPEPGIDLLLQRLDTLRPGLRPAADQRGIEPVGERTHSILLEGNSPLAGQRELVWAVSRKLPGHLFYLLMIAPESQFDDYQAQFEAIHQSIEFKGPPQPVGGEPGGSVSK